MIRLAAVTRRFGDVVALNRVDLDVDPGITALVGPNAAGKSTLMKVLTGHVKPTAGQVSILGMSVWDNPEVMRRLGFVPEQDAFYETMSGLDFVTHLAHIGGMPLAQARQEATQALEDMGMGPSLHVPIRQCSKGMRQRIKLAQALVHRPDVLLLDEPMLGCDPLARRRIHDRILAMRAEGATVLVASHILPEMERLTRDLAILHAGRLVARGRANEVRALLSQIPSRLRIHSSAPRTVAAAMAGWSHVDGLRVGHDHVVVETPRLRDFLVHLQQGAPASWKMRGFEVEDADLDSLFRYVAEVAA